MEYVKMAYDDIVMSNATMCELINSEMDSLDIERTVDMVVEISKKATEEDGDTWKVVPPIEKIAYIGREMYQYGYMMALYAMNESLKEYFRGVLILEK